MARVREITNPGAIDAYYLQYQRGFTWPGSIGRDEFAHFFPFHKPALEVLRAVTYELTTTRSAISFMHQTLKHQIKNKGTEIIRLWELFDEAVEYEEDPSGVHAGLVAIKTKQETDYRAYEACRRQIDDMTKGYLKIYRDKAVKTVQTLFLYHIARIRQQGLSPEEIANSVLIERRPDASADENIQHYESLAEALRKELRQIVQTFDEENRPRYRFDPVFTGVDPRGEFQKARDEADGNEVLRREAWQQLLALDEWPVRTRQMTIDLSGGVTSIFYAYAPFDAPVRNRPLLRFADQPIDVVWQGRQVSGLVEMLDLSRVAAEGTPLPAIESDATDRDFAVFIGTRPASPATMTRLLAQRRDPRVLIWTPAELTSDERDRLRDFAAYRKLVSEWQGKDTEDAVAVIHWVANSLQTEMARIAAIVPNSYGRGRLDALNNTQMPFHVAGELSAILTPSVARVLEATYESRDIAFEPPFIFRKEEGVKVVNGIVKTGDIPKNVKPNQDISAAQNFGLGLKIMKRGADRKLDTSENPHVAAMWAFIDKKLTDDRAVMRVETLYKNFMGIGGPRNYGLSRRMVQIYLLCLVRQGKVRVLTTPRSGLSNPAIDQTTIAAVTFSVRILDALDEVQKMAQPENWDVLRPYAEKLLEEAIPSTPDDAVVSPCRASCASAATSASSLALRTRQSARSVSGSYLSSSRRSSRRSRVVSLFSIRAAASLPVATCSTAACQSSGSVMAEM